MVTFGDTTENTTAQVNLNGQRIAVWGTPVDGGGLVDSISFYGLKSAGYNGDISAGLYEYIDYSSNYAGNLIAQTIVSSLSDGGLRWYTVTFDDPKPKVTNNKKYYICVEASLVTDQSIAIYRDAGAGYTIYESGYQATLENPWESEGTSTNHYHIYATYTSGEYTTFSTPVGSLTGWKWDNAELNVDSGMKSPTQDGLGWTWATITGATSYYIPSGLETDWKWSAEGA